MIYNIRVETKQKSEISAVIEQLEKIFLILSVSSKEHRNGQGYYHYIRIKQKEGDENEST